MKVFLSASELADWAYDKAKEDSLSRFANPEETCLMMIHCIEEVHYHIVSPEIRDACKRKVGILRSETPISATIMSNDKEAYN